ncbi:MAG: secretin N-terminal domain-containing protein [Limisphaerales bacterium]
MNRLQLTFRRLAPALALALGLVPLGTSCGPRPPNANPPATSTNAPSGSTHPASAVVTNTPASSTTNAAPASAVATNVPGLAATGPAAPGSPPGLPVGPSDGSSPTNSPDGIQVAFQGAQVDMVIQWLAQTTGKTVVKHPNVQCQLTIVSSKKVTTREAIDLVYRALALEGFNAIETRTSIFLVPEGKDPKLDPEILAAGDSEIPEGRQRIMKIFPATRVPATELRDKIRGVLSEKGTAEADERANAVIVTDYNDNLRLVAELLKELDVTSVGDGAVEIFPLKHGEAEELGNLISLILNAQNAGASSSARATGPAPGGPSPGAPPNPGVGAPTPPAGASTGSPSQIRIWPDRAANRLIVTAPRSRLADVRKLVELLDTDKPGDVTVRVLPLKHVQAADFVKEVQPLYQKMNARSPKESVEIAANERSNSLIILSSETNYKLVSEFVASLDTDDAQEKVIRTFALKNADAQDVAKQLQTLNQDQDSSSPYRYIYFSGDSRQATKKINVVADRRRNSIVVQAPPARMEGLAQMIRELDEPVADDSLAPRIFALKYVSAVDIEDLLNELFLKKQERRAYWYYDESEDSGTADRDVGRLYGKVRITSEPYSNTLIVTSNSKENLTVVEDILRQLDVPSQAGETTVRVPLRFANASALANNLNVLFAKNGSPPLRPNQPQPSQNPNQPPAQQPAAGVPAQSSFELSLESREDGYYPWLGGQPDNTRGTDGRTATRQVSDLVGRVRVVADERSNALLVSANLHLLPQIAKLIEELDAPTAQVLIEARILEVGTDKLDKLGVRWSPDGSQVFTSEDYDNSILAQGAGKYLSGFGGKTTVNNPAAGEVNSLMTTLRSGVLSSSINLDVLVQFLRKTTDASVLAAPQINVADNEMGRLFVGQQVPFVDNSQSTDVGSLVQSFQYKLVGVILEVTPRINNAGDVSLRIRAESSAIVPGQTVLGGAVVDTRNFRTDVTTKNGEILVLGGIIQKQFSETIRQVPLLADIPLVGWAFKKKDKNVRNVELMVFLRPQITRTPEEARKLLEELDTKAPLIAPWKFGGSPHGAKDQPKIQPAVNEPPKP